MESPIKVKNFVGLFRVILDCKFQLNTLYW